MSACNPLTLCRCCAMPAKGGKLRCGICLECWPAAPAQGEHLGRPLIPLTDAQIWGYDIVPRGTYLSMVSK